MRLSEKPSDVALLRASLALRYLSAYKNAQYTWLNIYSRHRYERVDFVAIRDVVLLADHHSRKLRGHQVILSGIHRSRNVLTHMYRYVVFKKIAISDLQKLTK